MLLMIVTKYNKLPVAATQFTIYSVYIIPHIGSGRFLHPKPGKRQEKGTAKTGTGMEKDCKKSGISNLVFRIICADNESFNSK